MARIETGSLSPEALKSVGAGFVGGAEAVYRGMNAALTRNGVPEHPASDTYRHICASAGGFAVAAKEGELPISREEIEHGYDRPTKFMRWEVGTTYFTETVATPCWFVLPSPDNASKEDLVGRRLRTIYPTVESQVRYGGLGGGADYEHPIDPDRFADVRDEFRGRSFVSFFRRYVITPEGEIKIISNKDPEPSRGYPLSGGQYVIRQATIEDLLGPADDYSEKKGEKARDAWGRALELAAAWYASIRPQDPEYEVFDVSRDYSGPVVVKIEKFRL